MFSINQFMLSNNLPKDFKIKVRNYLVYVLVNFHITYSFRKVRKSLRLMMT